MRRLAPLVLVLWAALVSACDSGTGKSVRSTPACDHFRDVGDDVKKGLLTAPEIREKLKEIERDADVAPEEVKAAAQAMLRASTQNDPNALAEAGRQMGAACASLGHEDTG